MSEGLLALLACLPIVVIFVLMVGFRWPATKAMPLAFVVTVLLAVLVWKTPANWILASSINGIVIALKRQERGQNQQSAILEIQNKWQIPVVSIITLDDLLHFLQEKDPQMELIDKISLYREQYGV